MRPRDELEREATPALPKVLLFDLGGVLMEFAGLRRLRAVLPDSPSEDEVRIRWLASAAVRDFEVGRISPQAFAERFVVEWSLDWSPTDFLEEFRSWARGFYPGVKPLLGELRTTHGLACLSNSNEIHMGLLRSSMDGYFDRQFISCETGLAKPDPRAFEAVVAELGVAASDIVFFDDAQPNVSAAAAVGMIGERVHGPDELRRRLRDHRLLTS